MRAALSTLRLRGFPQLTCSYFVNEFGDWFGIVALSVLVFDHTGSPLATAGVFLATQFMPALIVPPLVARLEGFPTRSVLPLLYVAEGAAFAALAVLSDSFLLAAVIAIAAIDGGIAGSARSLTRAASGAMLTAAGRLREGNALLNFGFTAAAAAAPALAGAVVALFGVRAALLANAISFLAVAAILLSARGIPDPRPEKASWRQRLRNGVDHVRGRPLLRTLLLAQAAAFVFFAMVIPVEIVFAKRTLGAGDFGYGLLLTAWGAGMVTGGLAFALLRALSLRILLAASTAAIGVAYLAMGAAPSLLAACVAAAVGGAGNGVQWVTLLNSIQELAAPAFHARVISLLESASSAMPGIGFVLGGAAAELLSARATFAIAGVGVLCVLAATVLATRAVPWQLHEAARSAPDVSLGAVPATVEET